MSSKWRRFEVLLPLQFNDGRDIPAEWLAEAVLEIVDHFGAASYETQKLEGHWRHGAVLYRDNLVRLVVDAIAAASATTSWSAEKSFHDLAEMPRMGPLKVHEGKFAGLRMWRVTGFDNFLIFYRLLKGGVAIERVAHAKQGY